MTSAGSDAAGDAARMLEASSLAAAASHEAGPVHQQLAAASIATVPLDYGTALPAHGMALVYSHLALKDTLNASSTCSYWRRCMFPSWSARCQARWRHWAAQPAASAEESTWRETYARRHKVDSQILKLLSTDACSINKRPEVFTTILSHGIEALDVLTAAARASTRTGLYVSIGYHAHVALLLLQGQLAADRIQQLLQAETEDSSQQQEGESEGQGDFVLETALQVAQALHPLSDVAMVGSAVSQLGDELASRMQAAAAAPGSRQALLLLNTLLFGDEQTTASAATPTAASAVHGNASSSSSSSSSGGNTGGSAGSSSSNDESWSAFWPRHVELWGPDLSGFSVPSGGASDLNIKGQPNAFEHPSSSCLDSVLANKTGLPITLAVLHRAVGRRCGLDLQLVNMPGQVLNRAVLEGGEEVYVDVFNGRVLDEQGLRQLWDMMTRGNNLPLPQDPQRRVYLPDMSAGDVCRRMLANLCNLQLMRLQRRADPGPAPIDWDLSSTWLMAPLMQLAPKYSPEAFSGVGPDLLGEQKLLEIGMAAVYNRLWPEDISLGPVLQLMRAIIGSGDEAADSRDLPDICPRTGTSVGTPVYLNGASQEVYLPLPRQGAGYTSHAAATAAGAPPGSSPACVVGVFPPDVVTAVKVLSKREGRCWLSTATVPCSQGGSHAAAVAGAPAAPLWASAAVKTTLQQAHQLLLSSWFEPGFDADLASFLQGCGQQLPPGLGNNSSSDNRQLRMITLECSEVLGLYFAAVWCDAATQQYCLVPTSVLKPASL